MLRFAADENFNNNIVRALRRRKADLDVVRVQDVGLSGADDPTVLEWAAQDGGVLLTHDVSTMTRYVYRRAEARLPMPGLIAVARTVPLAQAVEDLILLAEASLEGEWEGQVIYLPL